MRFCPHMSPPSRTFARPFVALTLSAGLILAAVSALADRPSSDRSVTTQILGQFQPDSGPIASAVARPVSEAKAALARADSAAASGDAVTAHLLEGLAREWAELALDVSRSVQVQQDAGSLQLAAADASLRAQRARAMLDELAARKSRAQGELNQLTSQTDAGPTPNAPSAVPASKPAPKGPAAAPRPSGKAATPPTLHPGQNKGGAR